MSLKQLKQEQIDEISMIDLATAILEEKKEAIDFNDMFHQIAVLKGFTEAQKEEFISQFYTDMNIDGGFMTIGTNKWGLKRWYPVEQMEEEIASLPQKRKKKKKKKKKKPSKLLEDELGVSEYDEDGEDLERDVDLTDEDLDLGDDDDDYEGDYEDDDLDEEEEEIVEDDISFVGDDDEDEEEDK